MMKKHIAFIVAAAMLILVACQPSKHGQQGQPETQPSTSVAPTQTTATPTPITKPTESTVSPTTVPPTTVTPTETIAPPTTVPQGSLTPDDYRGLNKDNSEWSCVLYQSVGEEYYEDWLDFTGCEEYFVYSYNKATRERVQISQTDVGTISLTEDYIFYVTQENPNQVICSTYDGTKQYVCYESQFAEITQTTDIAPEGTLAVLEGNQYLVLFDFERQTSELLFEYQYIRSFWLGFMISKNLVEFTDTDGRDWNYYPDTKEFEEVYRL